jgi:hypothetical protein
MSIDKTDIKNDRPGIALTLGLPPADAAARESAEVADGEQGDARTSS